MTSPITARTAPGPPVGLVSDRPRILAPDWAVKTRDPVTVETIAGLGSDEQMAELAEQERERQRLRGRLVVGLDNDKLDALLRMFDKPEPYGLDMHSSEDEEFTLDKMRSNLERFYASWIAGLLRAGIEIQRIRMWEEVKRSSIALTVSDTERCIADLQVYSLAWCCNLITATLLVFLMIMVLRPDARRYCFANRAQDDAASSEKAAANWADTMEEVITSMTMPGRSGAVHDVESQLTDKVQAVLQEDMEKKDSVGDLEGLKDRDKAIELYARPAMRIIGGLADKWERVAKDLLADVPTNVQLVHRLLRDAEHRQRPLPKPAPEPEQGQEDNPKDDTDDRSIKSRATDKVDKAKDKMNRGLRTKLRKTWDKAGWLKEEHVDYEKVAKVSWGYGLGLRQHAMGRLHISHDTVPARALLKRLPSGDDPDSPARRLTVSIDDVVALKKQGMDWPRRALTSFALNTSGAGGTGLEIRIRRTHIPGVEDEETIKLRSIVRRDELFSRLLSLGQQRWELL
ncbi:hypothetical protein IAU60_006785 [Kwoniella sp. DSM 27419]